MENQYIKVVNGLRYAVWFAFIMLLICSGFLVAKSMEKKHLTDSTALQDKVQDLFQALKPGDKMPESFWDMPMELDDFKGKKSNFKFGDMKGRIIIFDFWATTCKSCIENIPHMEQIQGKYPDELAIILVNSKRNRDTPGRINATMKRYKEQYKYDIGLFTILEDTLLTTLFPHNAIPSTAWINQEGIYMGNTMSNEVNEKNLESILKTGKADMAVTQIYRNFENRNDVPPLRDTAGQKFISEITGYNPYYLPTYPNVIHKNGHTSYQMVNNSFSFMLYEAYKKEVEGLAWTDYVFEPAIIDDIKYKLLSGEATDNTFSYQLYVRDSINQFQAEEHFREAFSKYFSLKVERKKSEIPIYIVSYNEHFDKIKTKGEMPVIQPYPGSDPVQYRNVSVQMFLANLFYYLDRPLVFDNTNTTYIDLTLPPDFGKKSMQDRLSFLEQQGIRLTPVTMPKEYVFISQKK
ncbi:MULTISPECIES: hypothetical protein [unclassified Sphingobacterium]|uniref:hypothetical protein n=1 Tax=unclassified Sphingobacterium TaxID=2609468 RepID=UPI001052AF12|nr:MULTISPECIES: hypothetical protein [unclassified Sphingobacterium]MCS3557428.1 thiol-disulfide isomerase/thioredoxin [Sphingobacterium sp. JUb21]TCQ96315.1 thiol-disulfide isomerase/thioredoxin [Sphingobacterium sp. JUb20]